MLEDFGLKSFCPQDSGVSEKIIGAQRKEFFQIPKKIFLCE